MNPDSRHWWGKKTRSTLAPGVGSAGERAARCGRHTGYSAAGGQSWKKAGQRGAGYLVRPENLAPGRVSAGENARGVGWPRAGYTGFIHKVLEDHYLKDHPAPEDCEYYMCGPPVMNTAVIAMLENLGVERENILLDDFGG